jgi:hypothetical protein
VSNVFVNLAVPAADGVGASTDVSIMGRVKTITIGGGLSGPALTIEFSPDNANWRPLWTFSKPGQKTFELAARYMRVRISGFLAGTGMVLTANVDVGATNDGTQYAQLVVPAGDGAGAASDVSALGTFNTVVIGGTLTAGTVHIEISQDNTAWQEIESFAEPGHFSRSIVAQYMRVRRSGGSSGTPVVYTVAVNPPVSGNDGETLINVEDVTALGNVNSDPLKDGSVAYVRTMDDLYTLTKLGGPYTPDGLEIIAAQDGGYWIAQTQGRWDDLIGAPDIGNRAAALTQEVFRDTALLLLHFRHDQDDSLHYVYQLPHKWRTTTAVRVHLHVMPLADPASTENAYFSGYYTWAPVNFSPVPAVASWTPFTATMAVANGEIYKHKIAEIAVINAPASPTPSTCLFLYLIREGTNVLDTYDTGKGSGTPAANLALLSSDLHYRAQRFGTILELSD